MTGLVSSADEEIEANGLTGIPVLLCCMQSMVEEKIVCGSLGTCA